MNVIDYSPYNFDDSSIISGSVAMSNALMFDTLNPDELEVEVVCNDTGKRKLLTVDRDWYTTVDNRGYVVMTNDIRQFVYGSPLLYYYDGVLQGKYYIRSVDRLSVDHFKLSAFSAVGMWASIQHMGGIYTGETAANVIGDLMNLTTIDEWVIAPDVANVKLYGWLPIASVRDNLQQILFAIGASLIKDAYGNPTFRFLRNADVTPIADDRIYIGGKLNYKTPATSVRVTEHSFYASTYDIEVSLFDNTDGSGAADNKLVTFDEPCHDLVATGLTLGANGANYAYVTGTGTLTGKKYTHTQKIFSVPTGVSGEPNEAKVEKATLVSAVNSANVAARVADYKKTAEEVACGIVMDNDAIKPASLISFNDPYGDATQGFIATMNITMSGKSKADCTIIKNYTPSHFGNNFSNVAVITSNTTWTIPAGKDVIRIVLGQGGQAGQNGFNGGDSIPQTWSYDFSNTAGTGGSCGVAGGAGKVYTTDIVSPSGTITFVIGAGGAIGSGEGAVGSIGGETTATYDGTTYSSEQGAVAQDGYSEIMSGDVYSVNGIDGIDGGNGGGQNSTKGNGQNVTFNGQTWYGGAYSTVDVHGANPNYDRDAYGGSGGGAAYGSNGGDGGDATNTWDGGGDGGDGANASVLPYTAPLGSGGAGGCGGGGGGVSGYRIYEESSGSVRRGWGGSKGHGGSYSNGTNGGSGYALIYY